MYTKKETTPDAFPIVVVALAPFDMPDDFLENFVIAEAVTSRLRNGKAPIPSKIRAKKLKEWLKDAIRDGNLA